MVTGPDGSDDAPRDGLTRREALRRLGVLGLGLGSASALLAACGGDDSSSKSASSSPSTSSTTAAAGASGRRPNILLIIADDMRYDWLPYMPKVRQLIQKPGRTFLQGRCNVPLCQPSRVGLLTGQTSKYNHEIQIGYTGTQLTGHHDNAIGKWIADAGYRCGFFGKYINFTDGWGGIDAPAGYATWRENILDDNGYSFTVHKNQGTEKFDGSIYSADYYAQQTVEFIDQGGAQPFMAIVTPTQPHAPPNPRRDLVHKYDDLQWHIVNEKDVSDKPPWIQRLEPLTAKDEATIRESVRGALRELAAVDDLVHTIVSSMSPDMLANTVIFFTSDNGVHAGEHRRRGAGTKSGPYEVGLRVPLLARGPGFEPGPDLRMPSMVFQDLAATLVSLAGATPGLPHQDGVPLNEMVQHPDAYRDRVLLHEIGQGFERQTGNGITTGPDNANGFRKLYRYPSVTVAPNGPFIYEAYDLDKDPNEFSNWANDPSRRAERDKLEAKLEAQLA